MSFRPREHCITPFSTDALEFHGQPDVPAPVFLSPCVDSGVVCECWGRPSVAGWCCVAAPGEVWLCQPLASGAGSGPVLEQNSSLWGIYEKSAAGKSAKGLECVVAAAWHGF